MWVICAGVALAGEHDAAVVVGDGQDSLDWYLWLTVEHGVPPARVELLRGATADDALAAASRAGAAADDGVVWFVVLGLHGPPLARVEDALGDRAPRVVVADVAELPPRQVRPGTTMLVGHGSVTPLVLGGLRGWADADHDGAITAAELYVWTARDAVASALPDPDFVGDGAIVLAHGEAPAPDLGAHPFVPMEVLHALLSTDVRIHRCLSGVQTVVTVVVGIPPSGSVDQVAIEEPAWAGTPIEACLAAAIRAIPFPATNGSGTTLHYPFVPR